MKGQTLCRGLLRCRDRRPDSWHLGGGRIALTFDDLTKVLDLAPGHRARGASFDRFRIFNVQSGDPFLEIYVDALSDMAGAGGPRATDRVILRAGVRRAASHV